MDQCARWFYSGVVRPMETVVLPAPPPGEGVEPLLPDDGDRCPMSGLRTAPLRDWIAQIVYEDGTAVFFAGSKNLFRFLLRRWPATADRQWMPIVGTFVTSYFDRGLIDARRALFVIGGDVLGPSGRELVPHRTLGAAQVFRKYHGGGQIVGFHEVTPCLLTRLE